jgi:hypothetical protein
MSFFDVSKDWCILVPQPHKVPSVNILAKKIEELRKIAGENPPRKIFVIDGASIGAKESDTSIGDTSIGDTTIGDSTVGDGNVVANSIPFVINYDDTSRKQGFAWRASPERIEIYAHSIQSLDNAINDFIGNIALPPSGSCFPLLKNANHTFG